MKKNPMPRQIFEIESRLQELEGKKQRAIKQHDTAIALTISSIIETIKWCYHMEDEYEERYKTEKPKD